jgi:restriction system protein
MKITDQQLEKEILRLQRSIETWAKRTKMWFDCGFTSWLERCNDEPKESTPALVMWSDGPLCSMWNGNGYEKQYYEFIELLNTLGYCFENADGVSIHFYAEDEELSSAFDSYFRWKWICSLVRPDFADVHEEIYTHFTNHPNDLRRLPHRQFEVLLARIFQSNGYIAELGPGTNDGGVDVRLWHRDPIGDVLTLVQAKRYAEKRSIELEAVAALSGVVETERANRGLLVTTSRFLPSAKDFASRQGSRITLADSSDVSTWCSEAASRVIEDKSTLISTEHVRKLISELISKGRDPRIVHGSTGFNMIINRFCIVLKETKYAALLMSIPNQAVSGDYQQGEAVPVLDENSILRHSSDFVFRTNRQVDENGRVSYWGGGCLYHAWSGKPEFFTYLD